MTDTLSPAPTFDAALTRTFGAREDFFRVLAHALRRRCGERVSMQRGNALSARARRRLAALRAPI